VVEEAFRYFELAVGLSKKEPGATQERARTLEGLADCYLTRDKAKADELFDECQVSYGDDEKAKARVRRKQAECWLQNGLGRGNGERARQLLELAQSSGISDPEERAEVEVLKGQLARFDGDVASMSEHFASARESFKLLGRMTRVADLTYLELLVSIQMADTVKAHLLLEDLRRINTGIDSNRTDAEILLCQGFMRSLRGETNEGIAELNRAVEIACPLGNYRLLSTLMTWRGNALLIAGSLDQALKDFLEGQEYSRTFEKTYDSAVLVHCESTCEVMVGRFKEAEGDIQDVIGVSSMYAGFLGSELRRCADCGLAMLLEARGDIRASAEKFNEGLKGLGEQISFLSIMEVTWREHYVDCLLKLGQKEEAKEHMQRAIALHSSFGNLPKVEEIRKVIASI
jgi:tetratricopeptide (TPR) repeat protein